MGKKKRGKLVEEAMRGVWGSLKSHLPYASKTHKSVKPATANFHRKCVREYAKLLHTISKLY